MTGAESFIINNFSEYDSRFVSCMNLIVYGYSVLLKDKKYSRKEILNLTRAIRGNKNINKIDLEDYLRNDLVTKYINPNKHLFGLNYFNFQSGAEEFLDNVKVGILDIKVCSPLLNGNTYYIFECKRLNKSIISNYVTEGVIRFINEQYYPDSDNYLAGMISFLESQDIKDLISGSSSFKELTSIMNKYQDKINLLSPLEKYKMKCPDYIEVQNFNYIFVSVHKRIRKSNPFELYHIVLDYNNLINE